LIGGSWVTVDDLEVGDNLTSSTGAANEIYTIQRVQERVMVYNLTVSVGTYVANGVVAHNKNAWAIYYPGP
jgi:hypothetical protein